MSKQITSLANPTIKQIRALRQRKERERSGLFFVEGIRLVGEAVQTGAPIEALIYAPELLTSAFAHEMVAAQLGRGVAGLEVSAEVFRSLAQKEGPQGLAAVVRQQWQSLAAVQPVAGPGWVALDAVQDPGNLGTILRTADAVGCSGLILIGPATDPYDPTTLRASMGALFSLQLVQTDSEEFAGWRQQSTLPLIGTSDAATRDYRDFGYPTPLVLLMGSERAGLRPELQALCDDMVSIAMVGRSDSLNLAVATGVVLYEIFYQLRGR